MKNKKNLRRFLWFAGFLFILLNVIAFLHAYHFTHFSTAEKTRTKDPGSLSFGEKLNIALTGVSNPRPRNILVPGLAYETIKIKSNRSIECWLIKVSAAKGTVILFHGYGGSKSSLIDKAEVFLKLGYNTLLVDFMGSGGSEGSQTTIGYKEAKQVKSCCEYLVQKGESRIILFGTSMGAVAIMKALHETRLPVAGIIIECPFGTMLRTVRNRFSIMGVPSFPMAHLVVLWGGVQNGFNAFDHNPVKYARAITCPTLLLYGDKDLKVTKEETIQIFERLDCPKKLVTFPLAGHENYLIKYSLEWTNAVNTFLQNLPAGDERSVNLKTSFIKAESLYTPHE
jgi:hypothetical protein